MAAPKEVVFAEDWKDLYSQVDTVLLDCDGVLWLGNECIAGAPKVVSDLRKQGKRVAFVTNNSTKSRKQYLQKFNNLSFEGVREEDIFCTASAAATYLRDILKLEGKVYLLGMEGMEEELQKAGLEFIGHGPDPLQGSLEEWLQWECDPDVQAVLVGFDSHFNYMKMMKAATYILKRDCVFVGTNWDASLPVQEGIPIVIPGTGSFVAAVSHVVGRKPDYVLGKPEKPMFDAVQQITQLEPSRTLMIGDRLNTDIAFGNKFGMKTLCVLSGTTQRADLSAAEGIMRPHYVAPSIASGRKQ